MKKIIIFIGFFLYLFSPSFVFGSQLHPRELSEVLPRAKVVLVGRVKSFKMETKEDQGIYLAYYEILPEEVILGKSQFDRIKAVYSMPIPMKKDASGKVTLSVSLIVDGSGLEFMPKEGDNYVFFFSSEIEAGEDYRNPIIRIESIDNKEGILKLIKDSTPAA